jgi:D-alanyl-lipoteichoic acid acyltransferase DltB (MBOAT superfamily)
LALIVNPIFSAPAPYNGAQVLLGVYAFAFQIYCDFSGYTDMARGLAKMMGFDLMLNFNLPYFAKNPSDFWRRWHISLSTWLRDYLYVPLGGNRKGSLFTYRNLMLTMLLGGLWHGAAWHFVIWGAYHGLLLCAYKFITPSLDALPKVKNKLFRKIWLGTKIILFFHLICLGWLFFRVESISQIIEMLKAVFSNFHLFSGMELEWNLEKFVFFTLLLMIIQCFQYFKKDLMVIIKMKPIYQTTFYLAVFYSVLIFGVSHAQYFIYFQF